MNSDQERAVLERYGWQYDYVGRKWVAPDLFEVSLDDLVAASKMLGPSAERRLLQVAREHGSPQ